MEDIETTATEEGSFGTSVSTEKTSKVTTGTGPEGKAYFTGSCRYCGIPIHNAEIKDGKAKCPDCGRDV